MAKYSDYEPRADQVLMKLVKSKYTLGILLAAIVVAGIALAM